MTGDDVSRAGGRRVALLMEYDGTAYRGSQYQDNGSSIQAELEAAINNLTAETVRAAFAGRTDAGVHALGQVAVFDTDSELPLDRLEGGLNHYLPGDIVVREAKEAPGFDPRRHAVGRRYRYRIDNRPTRPVIERNRVWQIGKPLDVGAMRSAAVRLVGEHDFAAFAGPYEHSTIRTLRRCDVLLGEGDEVVVEMEALAFLPHQVRRTVGPLVEVGLGRMTGEELTALLEGARPSSAQPAAPPCGLYLVEVRYEGFGFGPETRNETSE